MNVINLIKNHPVSKKNVWTIHLYLLGSNMLIFEGVVHPDPLTSFTLIRKVRITYVSCMQYVRFLCKGNPGPKNSHLQGYHVPPFAWWLRSDVLMHVGGRHVGSQMGGSGKRQTQTNKNAFPKNHRTLLWRGLDLYSRVPLDLETTSFEVPWFLGLWRCLTNKSIEFFFVLKTCLTLEKKTQIAVNH